MKPWMAIADKYKDRPEFSNVTFASIDDRDSDDETLLHCAAFRGKLSDVVTLVKLGANINAIGDMGNTPLMNAAMNGHLDIVKYLVEAGADVHAKNEFGDTALDWAQHSKQALLIAYLRQIKK